MEGSRGEGENECPLTLTWRSVNLGCDVSTDMTSAQLSLMSTDGIFGLHV